MDLNRRFENSRVWLHRLQRADEKTKKRYLVFSSVLAMILVVILWFFYLNLTLPKVASPDVSTTPSEASGESSSFWKTMGRGVVSLKEEFISRFGSFKNTLKEGFGSIGSRFKETKNFTIQP